MTAPRGPAHVVTACALALAVALPARAATDPSLGLPEGVHAAASVDLAGLLRDLPTLARQGLISTRLDALISRGLPDPRTSMDKLAVGLRLGPRGIEELVALATTREPVLPHVKAFMEREGGRIKEGVYRGVPFAKVALRGQQSVFSDLAGSLSVVSHDRDLKYGLYKSALETLAAGRPAAPGGVVAGASGAGYLRVQLALDASARSRVGGALVKLAHLTGLQLVLAPRGEGGQISLGLKVSLTGGIKARFAFGALDRKMSELRSRFGSTPQVGELLQAIRYERSGSDLLLVARAPREVVDGGLGLLLDALAEEIEAKLRATGHKMMTD